MTAMVRPISVNHTDFRYCRLSVFGFKILLTKSYIVYIHCKPVGFNKILQALAVKRYKSVKRSYLSRYLILDVKRARLVKRSLACLHRVYNILFDFRKLCFIEIAVQNVYLCGTHKRTLSLRYNLYALRRRIRTLVKLPRQVLYCEHRRSVRIDFGGRYIELRLRKYRFNSIVKQLLGNIFRIVPVYHAYVV